MAIAKIAGSYLGARPCRSTGAGPKPLLDEGGFLVMIRTTFQVSGNRRIASTGACVSAGVLARCLSVGACLILLGCSSAKVDRASEPPEARLAEQIDAVRAGRSNEIRLEREVVTTEDLSQLESLDGSLERLNLG